VAFHQQANPLLVGRQEHVKRRAMQDLRGQLAAGTTGKRNPVPAILFKLLNNPSCRLEKIGCHRNQRLSCAHRCRLRRHQNQRNRRQNHRVKPEHHGQEHRSEIAAALNRAFFHGEKSLKTAIFRYVRFLNAR
jgi:hypothetical protein